MDIGHNGFAQLPFPSFSARSSHCFASIKTSAGLFRAERGNVDIEGWIVGSEGIVIRSILSLEETVTL